MATLPGAGGSASQGQMADPTAATRNALMSLLTNQQVKTVGGTGDVAALNALLAQMMPMTSVAGMSPVIQAIFQEGFQKQMPALYNVANQTGSRATNTTTQQLMVNDLNARLAAQAAQAVQQQQANTAQVAASIAQNTRTPQTVTTKQQINPAGAVLGALALANKAGVFDLFGNGGGNSGTSSTGSKKKATTLGGTDAAIGGGLTDAIISGTLGGNDPWNSVLAGSMNLPAASTGSINPSSFMNGSPTNLSGDIAMQALGGLMSGQGLGQALPGMAMTAIPVVGPALGAASAVGDLFGINEISNITSGITNAIGDIGSAVVGALGCYITTAICELEGKADDCEELQTLRSFRDNWLEKQPGGQAMVQEYYAQAPKFLAALDKSGFKEQILTNFRETYIKPAVAAAQQGDNERAFALYTGMLADANDYIHHLSRS